MVKGYGACNRSRRSRPSRWGCRSPCPGTGAAARRAPAQGARPRRRRWSRPRAARRGHRHHPPRRPVARLPSRRAGFALHRCCRDPSDWARPGTPILALPIAPSAVCHSQSQPPRSSHVSSSTAQMRSKTPSFTHRWNVRWTELPSGNSVGRQFHWHPLRRRKIIASSAPRGSMRLRPVRLGGSSSLRTCSTTRQRSSGTRQMVGRGLGRLRGTAASVRWQSARVCSSRAFWDASLSGRRLRPRGTRGCSKRRRAARPG